MCCYLLVPARRDTGVGTDDVYFGPHPGDYLAQWQTETETREIELPMHHPNESFRADIEMYLPRNETLFESQDLESEISSVRQRTDTIPFETGSESEGVSVSMDREARERLMSDVMAEEWAGLFHFHFWFHFSFTFVFTFQNSL